MDHVHRLQRFIKRLRKGSQRVPLSSKKRPTPGIPAGLNQDVLEKTCVEHYSSRPRIIQYQHLSAWKSSGAYRLLIALENGRDIRLVFKEANYSREEIPAVEGLPVQIGIPEYQVYYHNSNHPFEYLPTTLLAEEVIPELSTIIYWRIYRKTTIEFFSTRT